MAPGTDPFAPLSVRDVGTGTRTMFRNFPQLLDEGAQTEATRSFLLGYICHLAADEVWITTVYRPNFDTASEGTRLTADQVQADIWGPRRSTRHGPHLAARCAGAAERRP